MATRMNYDVAAEILNRHIFGEEKPTLLGSLARNPERFLGLFRPSKPQAKIIQHILQSNEIRFGDAMEELIRRMIDDLGFTNLPTNVKAANGEDLSLDQHFTSSNQYYFVEQKVRDDHDSTKKRGQIENFERKLKVLLPLHPGSLSGAMYFIDPEFTKNKNYYAAQLVSFQSTYSTELRLFYGAEFFAFLGDPTAWDHLIDWLTRWKQALPDLPEINFDANPAQSFKDIAIVELGTWRRLLLETRLWDSGVMRAIFKDGSTLRLLMDYHKGQESRQSRALALAIEQRLEKYYPAQI